MYTLCLFIAALVCYGILIGIVIYTIGIYKKAKALNPYNETLEQIKTDIRVASAEKETIKAEIDSLRDDAGSYQGIIEEGKRAKAYLEQYGGSVEEAKAYIESLKRQTLDASEDLEKVKAEVDRVNAERNKAVQEVAEAVNRREIALSDLNNFENKCSDLENKISSLKADIDKLSPERARLSSELSELQKKVEEAKSELERIKAEKEKKELEVENAKGELASVNAQVAATDERLAHIQTKLDNIKGGEDVWGDLDTPVITRQNFDRPVKIKSDVVDEERELAEFSANLESCHIQFDRRTINAFHTSLKVEDSSPLVVLAGISGTGKSLLPQLYAEKFGFNFLNMAVQPRWDSSQDLFGFYNYAQFRYKATELSRLLWQYDVYNNENCTFKDNKNLRPMNIVLLDEMNLARVEYYFSDMLSKLETRKNIDVEKDESRHLAEIELECGSAVLPRHLFVDNNTLFVGTMNEDETTQALSDKIMDRANVLRFGRPKTLQAKADPTRFCNEYRTNNPRTIELWKRMSAKELAPGKMKDLETKIDEINDAMESMGRPFAHRVKKSIVDYVSNYPGVNSGRAFNDALSDQIEFKIMPKLNGIEKTNPNNADQLKALEDIISAIDTELAETFERAVDDNSSSFFAWTGVKR